VVAAPSAVRHTKKIYFFLVVSWKLLTFVSKIEKKKIDMDNLKQKKEEAVRKWKQLFEHKKEMEQKFLQYRNVDVYAQFG
jgi:hypothetical protein